MDLLPGSKSGSMESNSYHGSVDLGSTNEMAKLSLLDRLRGMEPPCDLSYDINSLLAGWLQSSPQNQLVVFTSRDSERNNFGGLWTYYFAGIWNQPFANQALVCDYNGMQHPDVLQNFAGYIGDLLLEPMANCPPSPALGTLYTALDALS